MRGKGVLFTVILLIPVVSSHVYKPFNILTVRSSDLNSVFSDPSRDNAPFFYFFFFCDKTSVTKDFHMVSISSQTGAC